MHAIKNESSQKWKGKLQGNQNQNLTTAARRKAEENQPRMNTNARIKIEKKDRTENHH
jgi:hypothetical protein